MNITSKNKETFLKDLFVFLLDILVFTSISFISFHFFGLAFFLHTYLLFKKLESLKKVNFQIFFFVLFFFFRKFLLIFILIHLALEIIMNVSSISYPGITFGNVFGNSPYLIQWYNITTPLGGTIWLLIGGYLFSILKKRFVLKFLILLIPIFLSLFIFYGQKKDCNNQTFVTVVNFEYMSTTNTEKVLFNLKKELVKDTLSELLILPEQTFRGINKATFEKTSLYKELNHLTQENRLHTILAGTTFYKKKEYIANGLFLINSNNSLFRVKKKLVPLTEYVPELLQKPFNKVSFKKNLLEDEIDIISKNSYLPLVCYEAFYPLYVKSIMKKNTKIIYILSSEKFLENSYFGLRQYNNIIRLRAIESRLPLLKASSYGSSVFYSPKGQIIEQSREKYHNFKINY